MRYIFPDSVTFTPILSGFENVITAQTARLTLEAMALHRMGYEPDELTIAVYDDGFREVRPPMTTACFQEWHNDACGNANRKHGDCVLSITSAVHRRSR